MIEVGTILQNRYRVEKQIGQGGMGQVYVATDERFKSTVAIKETIFQDLTLRKAFEREARLLNSLKHIALPRVSDHFNENDGQYLVMEYIAGEDLAEMIERNSRAFLLEDVLKWAYQLCDALDFLHSQNIIHRDIKPQNLKLAQNNHIVLLDFGLAKGNPTDAQHQTAAKSIFGYSRSYASLEQIQGTGTEPRSDLYSLSATLYHLLTGIPPADALTRAMNVLNGHSDPLISANLVNRQVPRGIAEILLKTMALNAGERPESAVSMRKKLEECDKTVDLNAAHSTAENLFNSDLLNQETKIKTAVTNVPNFKQSQIKTAIVSEAVPTDNSYKTLISGADSESVLTKVQPGAVEPPPRSKRVKALGAAAFGGLLLVGSAVSAVFLYAPDEARTNVNAEATNAEIKSVAEIPAPPMPEPANLNAAGQNSASALKNPDPKQSGNQSAAKTSETAKSSNAPSKNQLAKSKNTGQAKTGIHADELVINEDQDSIETKDMIIDENGIRMKNPPRHNRSVPMPPMPPMDLQHLTPAQIRRLERLGSRKNRIIIKKPAAPEQTP